MDFLATLDAELLLAINGWRALWADHFMYAFSAKLVWIPMYAALLYVLFLNLSWRVALAAVVTIALIVLFADQISASLIRPFIGRLRPSNLENPLSEWVQIVNGYRGGRYGFPSCHAANTFGLAFFVYYIFRHRRLTVFFLAWAVVTCYSRAYLGVHYPGDLLTGALIGFIGATLCCWLFRLFTGRFLQYDQQQTWAAVHVPIWVGGLSITVMLVYGIVMACWL